MGGWPRERCCPRPAAWRLIWVSPVVWSLTPTTSWPPRDTCLCCRGPRRWSLRWPPIRFRYDRTPAGAVQGLDPGRVAHVGTVAKTLAPGLRLGWISAPAELAGDLQARKSAADSGSPVLGQLAFADLLSAGEYERHIVRAHHVYRRRRDLLVAALQASLPRLQVTGAAAGMQLLLRLPDQADDVGLAQAAAASDVGVTALSPLHLIPSPDRGLLLGFGRLPEHRIPGAVQALSLVL